MDAEGGAMKNNVVQISQSPDFAMISNPSGTSWTDIPLEEALELAASGQACECTCDGFADGMRSFHMVDVPYLPAPEKSALRMLKSVFASLVLIALASLLTLMAWAYFAR